jgi:hypothetical protein
MYVLFLLWLSLVVLIPFGLNRVDMSGMIPLFGFWQKNILESAKKVKHVVMIAKYLQR